MKDYIAAPALAVLLHLALAFAIQPYASLMTDVGGMFADGNDVADIPKLFFAGMTVVGLVWIAAADVLVAVFRRSR